MWLIPPGAFLLFVCLITTTQSSLSPQKPQGSRITTHKGAKHLSQRFKHKYGEICNIDKVQWAKTNGILMPRSFHAADEQYVPQQQAPSSWRLLARTLYLIYLFIPAILTSVFAWLLPSFRNPYWYRTITYAISCAGAAFIKWGQWSSTRPDIFPEDLCSVLAILHSGAPVHDFKHTKSQVEEALKVPLEQVFDSFDTQPLASGSIAQVHIAMIKNQKVAVKVRHPRVAEQIDLDFRIMRAVGSACDRIQALKFLNLGHSMEQFSHTLASQTRLDVEGVHLLLLNENFKGWNDVKFPSPIFLSDAVLIETFEEGKTLSEFVSHYRRWRENNELVSNHQLREFIVDGAKHLYSQTWNAIQELLDKKAPERPQVCERGGAEGGLCQLSYELAHFVVSAGEDIYLKMLLADNLMHCDLHPGNILFHTVRGSGRIVLVDAGMVARLSDDERENFIGLLEALGQGDGVRAAEHVLSFSVTQTCTGDAEESFKREMSALFKVCCRGYNTGVDIGEVLRAVLKLIRQYQLRIDVNYATLLINLLCLEGIATALSPQYNLLDRAKPLLSPHSHPFIRPVYRFVFPLLLSVKRRSDKVFGALLRKWQHH